MKWLQNNVPTSLIVCSKWLLYELTMRITRQLGRHHNEEVCMVRKKSPDLSSLSNGDHNGEKWEKHQYSTALNSTVSPTDCSSPRHVACWYTRWTANEIMRVGKNTITRCTVQLYKRTSLLIREKVTPSSLTVRCHIFGVFYQLIKRFFVSKTRILEAPTSLMHAVRFLIPSCDYLWACT